MTSRSFTESIDTPSLLVKGNMQKMHIASADKFNRAAGAMRPYLKAVA